MVEVGVISCPKCGGRLRSYGNVSRKLRGEFGNVYWIQIRRLCCEHCQTIHRELPDYVLPYKQYRKDIIKGFINGLISEYDIEYEDYPCATTIKDWKYSLK